MSDQKSRQHKQSGGQQQGQGGQGKQQGQGGQPQDEQDNILQTITTLLSGLILLSAITFFVYKGISPSYPATFDVTTGEVRRSFSRYYLPLEVTNTGSRSTQSVGITVALRQNGQTVAKSSTTLPWVPAGSTREATVVFDQDPRKYDTEVNIEGYLEP